MKRFPFKIGVCLIVLGLSVFYMARDMKAPFLSEVKEYRQIEQTLLYEENFENDKAWQGKAYAYGQFAENHSFTVVDRPVFRGDHVGRFELRYGDPMVTKGGGPRSEVLLPLQENPERWYSFAVNFPAYGWEPDKDDEVVVQWKNSSGTPSLSLRSKNDKLGVRIGHDPEIPTSQWKYFDLGPVPIDQWSEFVFHIIHDNSSSGLVEVWKNGEQLISYIGPNMYIEDEKVPRWKIGIYKASWENRATDVKQRITFFDNIRIGDEQSTLEGMISR